MERRDVVVVGELNLDLILRGLPAKLEPEREILADGLNLTLGSSSAIFAHNLSVLGVNVGFLSLMGDDHLGRISLEKLAASGVDVSHVRCGKSGTSTGLTVILSYGQLRYILTYPGAMFEMRLADLDLDYLRTARHLHLSSFFLHRALRPGIAEIFRLARSAGMTTSLDPNDDPEDRWGEALFEVLKFVDVFLPNEHEARKIARSDDLDAAIDRLAGMVPLVAVKRGANGAIGRRGKEKAACAPVSVDAVDMVGAGDSFDAGFVREFLRGSPLEACLTFGNLAGAYSTTRPGGTEAFCDRIRLEQFFGEHGFPLRSLEGQVKKSADE